METQPNGARTAINTVIAPTEAFTALRAVPTWLWAYGIAVALALVGQFMAVPAAQHIFNVTIPAQLEHSERIAKLPADQRTKVVAQQLAFGKSFAYAALVVLPFAALLFSLIQASTLTAINAMVRGAGNFKQFWALSMNVQIVGFGISYVVIGLLAVARGPDAFSSQRDFYAIIPSLGWLYPGSDKTVATFLQSINVFAVWATILITFGIGIIAGFSRVTRIAVGVLFLTAAASTVTVFSRFGQ